MIENLFKFPIVMVDGDNEERKQHRSDALALDDDEDVDIIMGEVECPYYDFVSVADRWLPTEESFQLALQGTFEACGVVFIHSGSFVVPWTKEKFKKEFKKFMNSLPNREEELRVDVAEIIKMKKSG